MERTVSVATVKAQLSEILAGVKAGETVIITDRGRPVARIEPYVPPPGDLDDLVRAGVVKPPTQRLPPGFWDSVERPPDPDGLVLKALLEDREEGP